MVSTRQMTTGTVGGTASGNGEVVEQNVAENGPAKSTRQCAAIASTSNGVASSKSTSTSTSPPKQIHFLDLPQEIIEKVFSFMNYKNVCHLRLVCTRFDQICGHVLNTTFQRLQHTLLERFHDIKKKMPRRESARRNHYLACESDIIETLHMRLTLLQMSLGKHIERKHCCFFPGEILDEVFHILHYIQVTPKLARPYKVTDELFDLSTMAMEYFKEKIEPNLPEIAYFSTDFLELPGGFASTSAKNYLCLDSFSVDMEKENDRSGDSQSIEASPEAAPQSNIVLRKGIRKIKQGMKRYNSQLTMLRQDVRSCRQKSSEQQKLMSEHQKQLAEQQKQIMEYATRMDDNEKKNDEISRKFSTLLQELNKCKTELQYWRSKSPATPLMCSGCGSAVLPNHEEFEALINQGLNPEQLELEQNLEFVPIAESSNTPSTETQKITVEEVVDVPTASTSSNKRKHEDNKETRSSKTKTRRVMKARNNKRNKL